MGEGGDRDGDLGEDQPGTDPVGRARARLERAFGGRPLSVYGVLAAGVLVLVVLLVIIWLTATGGDEPTTADTQCFPITAQEAQVAVERGQVTLVRITVPRDGPEFPIAARIDLGDGSCRELPAGAANRDGALLVLGAVEFYNRDRAADERISKRFQEQAGVPPEFLATATPTPTVGPTETPVPPTVPPTAPPTLPPASPTALPPTEPPMPAATAVPPASPTAAGSPVPDPLPALQTETP